MSGFMLSGCHVTLVLDVLKTASEGDMSDGKIYRKAVIQESSWASLCAPSAQLLVELPESDPSPGGASLPRGLSRGRSTGPGAGSAAGCPPGLVWCRAQPHPTYFVICL